MQNLRTIIYKKSSSHFGAFSNKCTKGKKLPLKSDTITYLFDFNGMEKDNETYGIGNAIDFGARIYEPRLGKWMSKDCKAAKYPSFSPFSFCNCNPILFIDPNGKVVYIYGADAGNTKCALQNTTSLQLSFDFKTNQLTAMGEPQNDYDRALLQAITDPNIKVNLHTTKAIGITSADGSGLRPIGIGAYEGSKILNVDASEKEKAVEIMASGDLKATAAIKPSIKVEATQIFNLDQAEAVENAGGEQAGRSAGHEILEGYFGALLSPGGDNASSYPKAHAAALSVDPIAAANNDKAYKLITYRGTSEYGWEVGPNKTKVRFSDNYDLKSKYKVINSPK
jgi:RHS repeat-associated protein